MTSGADLARAWFEQSPFVRQLSLELVAMERGEAKVRMPYSPQLATAGDVVHGGAISSLIDTAAALAAWSEHDPEQGTNWGTVALSVTFQAPVRSEDVVAAARVTRRGRSLCFITITVEDAQQRLVAEALVTYRLG